MIPAEEWLELAQEVEQLRQRIQERSSDGVRVRVGLPNLSGVINDMADARDVLAGEAVKARLRDGGR